MKPEIIDKLSVISEEEHEILDGQKQINKTIYTEKKEMIVDCEGMLYRRSR